MTGRRPPRLPCALALAFALAAAGAASAQDLYVVSQGNQRVLQYAGGDGSFVRTVVEGVSVGFRNPGGIALRPGGIELAVSSTGTGELWRYDLASGDAIPPPAATGLIQPGAVAFDATGAVLYFLSSADLDSTATDAIRSLTLASGAVATLATDATAAFAGLAPSGSQLFASDALNGRIVRYPTSGGSGTTVISGLASPGALLLRSPTQLLVADPAAHRVAEYAFDGSSWSFVREVLPASAGVVTPSGLALAPDGRLCVSDQAGDRVVAVDLATLAVSPLVAAGAGGLAAPRDLAWSGSTLLVASVASNAVLAFDAAGSPQGTAARGITAPADRGLAFFATGRLVVASSLDNDVVEYDAATGSELGKFYDACPTSLAEPYDAVFGPDGDLYVSCPASDGVFRFDAASRAPLGFFVGAGSGGLTGPRGLAFGPDGDLYVASASGEVLAYDGDTGAPQGVFVDATGNGGGAVDPWGLAFQAGSLFVASSFTNEVREFDAASGAFVRTFVAAGSGGLSAPTALAFGPGGDLYVASSGDGSIKRYAGASGAFVATFVAPGVGGLDGPFDLAFGPGPVSPVPSLGGAGAAALALVVWLVGARGLRRRDAVACRSAR